MTTMISCSFLSTLVLLCTVAATARASKTLTAACNERCGNSTLTVCGSDGTKYDNPCLAACANAAIVRIGSCDDCGCTNTVTAGTVCGSDGVPYGSLCLANCARVATTKAQACKIDCTSCPSDVKDPVCISTENGMTTFNNCCLGQCRNASGVPPLMYNGACVRKCDRKCGKEMVGLKYCCSGREYPSACHARCLSKNSTITCQLGPCRGPDALQEFVTTCPPAAAQTKCTDTCRQASCPAYPEATCVINPCTPRFYRCRLLSEPCEAVFMDVMGNIVDCCNCQAAYNPACGKDGVTYPNRCVAQCVGGGVSSVGKCDSPRCTNSLRQHGACKTSNCAAPGEVCQLGAGQCCNQLQCVAQQGGRYGVCTAADSS